MCGIPRQWHGRLSCISTPLEYCYKYEINMGWVRRYAWNDSWSVEGRMPLNHRIHMRNYECRFSRSMRWNNSYGRTAFEEEALWLTLVLTIFIPDEISSRFLFYRHFDISDHRADNPWKQTVQWLRFLLMHVSVRFFLTGKLLESVVCCSLLFYFGLCFRRCLSLPPFEIETYTWHLSTMKTFKGQNNTL